MTQRRSQEILTLFIPSGYPFLFIHHTGDFIIFTGHIYTIPWTSIDTILTSFAEQDTKDRKAVERIIFGLHIYHYLVVSDINQPIYCNGKVSIYPLALEVYITLLVQYILLDVPQSTVSMEVQGIVYVPCEYDEITRVVYEKKRIAGWDEECQYLLLRKGDKYGLWSKETQLLPTIYDEIMPPTDDWGIKLKKDDKWGYLDKNNQFTTDISKVPLEWEDCLDHFF